MNVYGRFTTTKWDPDLFRICHSWITKSHFFKVYNGSHDAPYTNPGAPVHVVTGSAGCKEGREPFVRNIPEWSAFHSQVSRSLPEQMFTELPWRRENSFRLWSERTELRSVTLIVALIDWLNVLSGLWLHQNESLQHNPFIFRANFCGQRWCSYRFLLDHQRFPRRIYQSWKSGQSIGCVRETIMWLVLSLSILLEKYF